MEKELKDFYFDHNIDNLHLPNKLSYGELKQLAVDQEQRAIQAEEELATLTLLVKDVINLWPTITIRTLSKMTDKLNALKAVLK